MRSIGPGICFTGSVLLGFAAGDWLVGAGVYLVGCGTALAITNEFNEARRKR